MSDDIKKGLLGIVVDETEVSKVMPEINSLTYRGYAAQDLCEYCRFEEVAYLILNKDLPNSIELKNKICLDIGASTGGFTHVLLRGGVQKVYAVDVGRFQLAGEVKSDPRVVNLENTDARLLNNRIILNPVDLIVCDVSFISVKKVLLPCMALSKTGGQLLCLFKPQFEVGPGKLKKTGVLTDVDLRIKLLRQMERWFLNFKDWKFKGSMQSSLPGREGNKEFFILAEKL